MSGLVGWVDFRRDLGSEREVVASMTETMRSRGPDTHGEWFCEHAALGYRGLSISGTVQEKQPMQMESDKAIVSMVHAGEIYNSADLCRELKSFGRRVESRSDIEVLLQSFLQWGNSFVDRLHGMFVFAIWDGRARRLLLGRDRLGIKPLYYFEYPEGILFASEPKGIIANSLFKARLDLSALPTLLQPRLAMPGETPLSGLREVPPAHLVSYSRTGLSLHRYWRLTSAPHDDSFRNTARHVRELMEDIVHREIVAGVPAGAMLSGGVDSTSVAALGMKILRDHHSENVLDTFCVRFETDCEHFRATELRPEIDAPYAAGAAAFIGSRHRTVTASIDDLKEVIPSTRRARDLPGWGQFDASMYLLFSQIRRACKVVLTGEAADEIFGGYPYFFKHEILQRPRFPWLGDGPKLSDHLSPEVRQHVDPEEDERSRYERLISEVPRLAGEDPVNARMREIFYLGLSGPLAVILDRKDRMSASQGLEVRIPFCDHRLIEYLWNVPWSMKSNGGVKGLLKAAMADLLPASTLQRQKSAYPHIQNPDYDDEIVREATEILNDTQSPLAWMFNVPNLKRLIGELLAESRGMSKTRAARSFPGGANPTYMLIHLIEINQWIKDYRVSIG